MARGRGGRTSGARPSRGRGRGRGGHSRGGSKFAPARSDFQTSRLSNIEDADKDDQEVGSEELSGFDDDRELDAEDDASEHSSDEDSEPSHAQSYADLLHTLQTRKNDAQFKDGNPRKRQRLNDTSNRLSNGHAETEAPPTRTIDNEENVNLEMDFEEEEDGDDDENAEDHVQAQSKIDDGNAEISDSDDEAALQQDPYEQHYALIEEKTLAQAVSAVKERRVQTQTIALEPDLKRSVTTYQPEATSVKVRQARDLHLKQRFNNAGERAYSSLTTETKDITADIFSYRDIIYGHRTLRNTDTLRQIVCLHALNHVFKTRGRVLKNNNKLAHQQTQQNQSEEALDIRDQGFTRPKVLIIVPTKQACVRFVESIVQISGAEQQENKSRFLETFSREEDEEPWHDKPADFQELFGGNHEEDFRVGLKFTRKTIKFFSGFYNSDIILASALGLMRTITSGGGKASSSSSSRSKVKGTHDADFLSSIEVAIMDNASAIQMQNWQHVDYIFSQLNHLPKDSHGCDFSRVRSWYLDGNAGFLRQNIILSAYLTPEINALASKYFTNVTGRAKYTPRYKGAMTELPPTLPLAVTQTFLRFESTAPATDSDARFKYFTSTVLSSLFRPGGGGGGGAGGGNLNKGTLLFVPSYADFTRLRNFFSTSAETTNLSFGQVSEYTDMRDVSRARSHFTSGRISVLMYSERAHHHFRYKIRGVRRVVFYGVPENPVFWPEVVSLLGLGLDEASTGRDVEAGSRGVQTSGRNSKSGGRGSEGGRKGKGLVRAMFSKWDVLKLERIVGTERVGRLIADRHRGGGISTGGGGGGDVFEFV